MREAVEKIINVIKLQAEMFLLDANEFYPFGTYINKKGEIVPVGAYSGDDYPSSLEIINSIEKAFKVQMQNGDCETAVIAVNVTINENNRSFNAIEMRIFESSKGYEVKYLKYKIKDHFVEYYDG